jgi:stress-induced morphogen
VKSSLNCLKSEAFLKEPNIRNRRRSGNDIAFLKDNILRIYFKNVTVSKVTMIKLIIASLKFKGKVNVTRSKKIYYLHFPFQEYSHSNLIILKIVTNPVIK